MYKFLTILLFIFLQISSNAQAVDLPKHSKANYYGGWSCDRGYKKMGNICEEIILPTNSELDYSGYNWACKRGYRKNASATDCIALKLPENAELDYSGNNWKCNKGFKLDSVSNNCNNIEVPKNAAINYLGTGWECNRGFKKDISNGECELIIIPKNAELDYMGKNWTCSKGYKKDIKNNVCEYIEIPENAELDYSGSNWRCKENYKKASEVCLKMTAEEITEAQNIKKAIYLRMQRRAALGVSGDDCETEYKTNAEVCVRVTNTEIDCRENYDGNGYRSCEISANYELETDYKGSSYLDVDVNCEARIDYYKRDSYSSSSDSEYESQNYSLYANDSEYSSIDFDFSFPSYHVVYKARIDSVECEIDSVDLW